MHRRRPPARRSRWLRQLRDRYRAWLANTPRRALDSWALAIETELAARPWPYRERCYSADCLYCEGNRAQVIINADSWQDSQRYSPALRTVFS